jgi:hypothetical protein
VIIRKLNATQDLQPTDKQPEKMRKSIQALGLTAMLLTPMLMSCETQAQKDEKVKAAQEALDKATQEAADLAAKEKQQEEWAAYKKETNERIQANTDRIAELRVKKAKPGKVLDPLYAAKIDALQNATTHCAPSGPL